MYFLIPTRLAVGNFILGDDSHVPMLNEEHDGEGDTCYFERDAAKKAGKATCPSEGPRNFAIVHVTYESSLHEKLAYEGHIREGGLDAGGRRLWSITPSGCAELNRKAQVTMEIISLPVTAA
jgi:hypothetical protein